MIIDAIPGFTRALGKPLGWNEQEQGQCGTLPIRDVMDYQTGLPFMWSQWRPEPAELAILNAGGSIHLGIQGTVHPVVSIGIVPSPDPAGAYDLAAQDATSKEEFAYRNDPERRQEQTPDEIAYEQYLETQTEVTPMDFGNWRQLHAKGAAR